jgi:hypothetical protein
MVPGQPEIFLQWPRFDNDIYLSLFLRQNKLERLPLVSIFSDLIFQDRSGVFYCGILYKGRFLYIQ